LTASLAPHLLGTTAVIAYSYMALVPIIQPPIMRLLTTSQERSIRMRQMRKVTAIEKILFPIVGALLILLLVPKSAPLMSMFMLGNLFKESRVVERLTEASRKELINVVTIFLGIAVGTTMTAEAFLNLRVFWVLLLGLVAFSASTAGGILLAKALNLFLKEKINPLIGSAGVSAVPMAARVSQVVGVKADPQNHLLMHAMGPNVAGVIGTVVAAGMFLSLAQ
jgi:oxaloacetate decarboxylase beta subunit